MPNGVSAKGYKMTQNRKRILELLVRHGGTIASDDGRAGYLVHEFLSQGTSYASLYAGLKELDNIGFISRDIEGRRTYGITITDLGRSVIGAEEAPSTPADDTVPVDEPLDIMDLVEGTLTDAEAESLDLSSPVTETDWDWQEEETHSNGEVPDGIDYDILLGLFLKAAARGLEKSAPTSNDAAAEIEYYKQEATLANDKVVRLEEELGRERAASAQAIAGQDQARAERDQLEKNFKILMSRFESKSARGGDSIRSLIDPETRSALDALMRSVPTRRGE